MKLGLNKLGLSNTSAGGVSQFLDNISSVCCDLSASLGYTSGDNWENLIASPADSGAHDFYLGLDGTTDGTEPVYVTSQSAIDSLTETNYFDVVDGDEIFVSKTAAEGMWLDAHKNNKSMWVAVSFYMPYWLTPSTDHSGLLGNTSSAVQGDGFRLFFFNTNNALRVSFFSALDAGSGDAFDITNADAVRRGDRNVIIFTKEATTRAWKAYLNTGASVHKSGTVLDLSNAVNAVNALAILDGGPAQSDPAHEKFRIYDVAYGNGYLTDAEATSIISKFSTRLGGYDFTTGTSHTMTGLTKVYLYTNNDSTMINNIVFKDQSGATITPLTGPTQIGAVNKNYWTFNSDSITGLQITLPYNASRPRIYEAYVFNQNNVNSFGNLDAVAGGTGNTMSSISAGQFTSDSGVDNVRNTNDNDESTSQRAHTATSDLNLFMKF